jgi:hypothetical protein
MWIAARVELKLSPNGMAFANTSADAAESRNNPY